MLGRDLVSVTHLEVVIDTIFFSLGEEDKIMNWRSIFRVFEIVCRLMVVIREVVW